MKVFFVGAGPGAPDLITVRGLKILSKCYVCIYAGSLVSKEHLYSLPEYARVYNSASMTLDEIGSIFLSAKKRDLDVVRLHTGDPSIYSATGEQIAFCIDNNIECEVIPGVSSFTAAAAVLKRELTCPGVSQTVILTRYAGRTSVPELEKLEILSKSQSSMCIFLSVRFIDKITDILKENYPPDTPVAVIVRASWPDEKVFVTDLAHAAEKIAAEKIKKTAMILVGKFIDNYGEKSRLYSESFGHEYRQRKDGAKED